MDTLNAVKSSSNKLSQEFFMIAGQQYPVTIEGDGKIPCLIIGLGSLMLRALSESFKETFTVYATDLYFKHSDNNLSPDSLDMDSLTQHVLATIEQLKLNKPIILGYSCFGIVALGVAKKAADKLGDILLVAAAPQWLMHRLQRQTNISSSMLNLNALPMISCAKNAMKQ